MAENEAKKSKQPMQISGWYVVLVVYIVFSLAYGFYLNQENAKLHVEVEHSHEQIRMLQENKSSDLNKVVATLDSMAELVTTAKNDLLKNEAPEVVVTPSEVYTGSNADTTMVLTLSENNVATLVVGETLTDGTYVLENNVVTFTSQDGATVYAFNVLEDGSLTVTYNDAMFTLVK